MPKYRRKPVVIDAERFYPDQLPWPDDVFEKEIDGCKVHVIATLEGDLRVSPGDYVITGVHGEHYACKPDIFAKIYEPVDAATE